MNDDQHHDWKAYIERELANLHKDVGKFHSSFHDLEMVVYAFMAEWSIWKRFLFAGVLGGLGYLGLKVLTDVLGKIS